MQVKSVVTTPFANTNYLLTIIWQKRIGPNKFPADSGLALTETILRSARSTAVTKINVVLLRNDIRDISDIVLNFVIIYNKLDFLISKVIVSSLSLS